MKIMLKSKDGKAVLFTNKGLEKGDKVWPLLNANMIGRDVFITGIAAWDENDVHTVLGINSGLTFDTLVTDKAAGPEEIWFKLMVS